MNKLYRHTIANVAAGIWLGLVVYATAPAPEQGGFPEASTGATLLAFYAFIGAGMVVVGTAITYMERPGHPLPTKIECARYAGAFVVAAALAAAGYALVQPLYGAGPPSTTARWIAGSTTATVVVLAALRIRRNFADRRRDIHGPNPKVQR